MSVLQNSDSQFHTAQLSPSQLTQSLDKSITNTNSCLNPIMFAKFTGRQELRFKRKQGEGVLGPKVSPKKKNHMKYASLFFMLKD